MNLYKLFFIVFSFTAILQLNSCAEDLTEPYHYENFYGPSLEEIHNLSITSEDDFFAATQGGTYVSTDNAKSWNLLTNFENKILDVADIIITSDDYIFSSCDTMFTSYIYFSSDKGNSWTKLPPEKYMQSFELDSNENVYICGSGLQKSTDKGNSWVEFYSGYIYDA